MQIFQFTSSTPSGYADKEVAIFSEANGELAGSIAISINNILKNLLTIGASAGTEIIGSVALELTNIVKYLGSLSGASGALASIDFKIIFGGLLKVVGQVTDILGPGSEVVSQALATLGTALQVSYECLYAIFFFINFFRL